ncbi:hypothetical protein PR202_gb08768 [Eleusine coracana subsp. coracana]|uniref:DNA-(apurinic or apyrimidinic site) lyase n=1 Tax=Eleusine coracana subsp. coracana TaxID=191504 RepID=A0AAV5EF14_ELECO|nr:hypothetical protein PR202_gb08768 [Eleusine coracana subsp. coracana]
MALQEKVRLPPKFTTTCTYFTKISHRVQCASRFLHGLLPSPPSPPLPCLLAAARESDHSQSRLPLPTSLPPRRLPAPVRRGPQIRKPRPPRPSVGGPPPPPLTSTAVDEEAQKEWHPLPLSAADLSSPAHSSHWPDIPRSAHLSLSAPLHWRRPGPHLLSLPTPPPTPVSSLRQRRLAHSRQLLLCRARAALCDYLNAAIPLADLWRQFAAADERFAEADREDGVDAGRGYGSGLARWRIRIPPTSFPARLARLSEQELRDAGAKYIVGTAIELQAKPGGGEKWLASLREKELPEVIEALCTLPGVGPKVAACVALFSLDQNHAIPVDTHVWKVATQYLLPELAGKSLTPKLSVVVSDAFVTKFGSYAGWAQNVLFIGQLLSQKLLVAEVTSDTTKSTKRKRGKEHT